MSFLVRFFNLADDSHGSIYGPFSNVEIVDDGECVQADGEIVAPLQGRVGANREAVGEVERGECRAESGGGWVVSSPSGPSDCGQTGVFC